MKTYTDEQLKNMPKEEAKHEFANIIYAASQLIELLEGAGKIRGNGHHARQKIVAFAAQEIEDRWCD